MKDLYYLAVPIRDGSGDVRIRIPSWIGRCTKPEAQAIMWGLLPLPEFNLVHSILIQAADEIHGIVNSLTRKGFHGLKHKGDTVKVVTSRSATSDDDTLELTHANATEFAEKICTAIDFAALPLVSLEDWSPKR